MIDDEHGAGVNRFCRTKSYRSYARRPNAVRRKSNDTSAPYLLTTDAAEVDLRHAAEVEHHLAVVNRVRDCEAGYHVTQIGGVVGR